MEAGRCVGGGYDDSPYTGDNLSGGAPMIRAEQIPMEVKLRLRAILHDGETDEAKAIAAALSAWKNVYTSRWIDGTPVLILPLPQEPRDE